MIIWLPILFLLEVWFVLEGHLLLNEHVFIHMSCFCLSLDLLLPLLFLPLSLIRLLLFFAFFIDVIVFWMVATTIIIVIWFLQVMCKWNWIFIFFLCLLQSYHLLLIVIFSRLLVCVDSRYFCRGIQVLLWQFCPYSYS